MVLELLAELFSFSLPRRVHGVESEASEGKWRGGGGREGGLQSGGAVNVECGEDVCVLGGAGAEVGGGGEGGGLGRAEGWVSEVIGWEVLKAEISQKFII